MNEPSIAAVDHGHSPSHSLPLAHPVPLWVLAAVWITLLIFTYLTVAATQLDLGSGNLILALGIATIKASLVALYFMHLRYDHPFHGIILISALMFVMIFIVIALIDTQSYNPSLIPGYAPAIHK